MKRKFIVFLIVLPFFIMGVQSLDSSLKNHYVKGVTSNATMVTESDNQVEPKGSATEGERFSTVKSEAKRTLRERALANIGNQAASARSASKGQKGQVKPSFMSASEWQLCRSLAQYHGTDPYFIAAVSYHETRHGRFGAGRTGYYCGVGVPTKGKRASLLKGWSMQANWTAQKAAKVFGKSVRYDNVARYAREVQKPDNPVAWYRAVWRDYSLIKRGRL